jgi:two-component system response regulator HupR/HoxA
VKPQNALLEALDDPASPSGRDRDGGLEDDAAMSAEHTPGQHPPSGGTVLVLDSDPMALDALRRALASHFQVLTATGLDEADAILTRRTVQVLLYGGEGPIRDASTGAARLRALRQRWPDPVCVLIASDPVEAGAADPAPGSGLFQQVCRAWQPEDLRRTVEGAVRLFQLHRANRVSSHRLRRAAEHTAAEGRGRSESSFGFGRIVHAQNSPLHSVCETARKIAPYDISVLITGESGTGKELMARALHFGSPRAAKPFVVQNCGALPDALLESELFGSRKGAFTGAHEDRAGLFEAANGGTIFLDEIGETSAAFQVKLLRALQEGEIRPLGAAQARQVDVRVIAATNRDLEEEVQAKRFRRDLYYRLAAFPLHLPPLRERRMDIPLLATLLLGEAMRTLAKPASGFTDAAMASLCAYDWPGNVREMRNEIMRMVALSDEETVDVDVLSAPLRAAALKEQLFRSGGGSSADPAEPALTAAPPDPALDPRPLKAQVEALEQRVIAAQLARLEGNISQVAAALGLSRVGLRAKMQRYGLRRDLAGNES